jgi:large conductance mechanosensitive channel
MVDKNTVTKKTKTRLSPTVVLTMGESQFKGFVEFIRTQGVIGLAIGLVIGGAVATLVRSLIDNVIMPPLGLLLGSAEGIKGLSLIIGETSSGEPALWKYGIFLNDLINFLVIALVVYLFVRILKMDRLDLKK